MLRDTNYMSEPKNVNNYISAQTAFKSPKFLGVIFKKHNLKVYANYVQCNLTHSY